MGTKWEGKRVATNIARFIGGPLDGMTIRVEDWPAPTEWVCGGDPPQRYAVYGDPVDADDTIAAHPSPVRYVSYSHEGDWVPPT